MEEKLVNAQKSSDEWQSKHRLLQEDIEAVNMALAQVDYPHVPNGSIA